MKWGSKAILVLQSWVRENASEFPDSHLDTKVHLLQFVIISCSVWQGFGVFWIFGQQSCVVLNCNFELAFPETEITTWRSTIATLSPIISHLPWTYRTLPLASVWDSRWYAVILFRKNVNMNLGSVIRLLLCLDFHEILRWQIVSAQRISCSLLMKSYNLIRLHLHFCAHCSLRWLPICSCKYGAAAKKNAYTSQNGDK